nr:Na/Pi symporter [Candidatus Contubernalis alkalaceticus]
MSKGLKEAASYSVKQGLRRLAGNPLMGLMVGTAAAVVLQSSSITTVMVVGLVNSELITLKQGISMIVGANIGTTVTAQVIAFPLHEWAVPAAVLGLIFLLLSRIKSKSIFRLGKILLGGSFLFIGLNLMSSSLSPLRESTWIIPLLIEAGEVPFKGILMGAVTTFFFQSSSAVIAIIMAMAQRGIVSLPAGIAIILGADMGTCITSMIASVGTNLNARRAALAHLIFNVIGAFCMLPFFHYFTHIVMETSSYMPRQIANAHTFYNIFNAIIIIPFINFFTRFIIFLMPGRKEGEIRPTFFFNKGKGHNFKKLSDK